MADKLCHLVPLHIDFSYGVTWTCSSMVAGFEEQAAQETESSSENWGTYILLVKQ